MGQRINQQSIQILGVPSNPHAIITQLTIQVLAVQITPIHGLSSYVRDGLCNHIFRSSTFAKPLTLFVALYSFPPRADGTGGTEFSGGGYRRKLVLPDDGHFTAPTSNNGTTSNADALAFDTPTANWGTCTAWAIWDDETAGNMLALSTLSTGVTITAGSNPRFLANALTVQVDS